MPDTIKAKKTTTTQVQIRLRTNTTNDAKNFKGLKPLKIKEKGITYGELSVGPNGIDVVKFVQDAFAAVKTFITLLQEKELNQGTYKPKDSNVKIYFKAAKYINIDESAYFEDDKRAYTVKGMQLDIGVTVNKLKLNFDVQVLRLYNKDGSDLRTGKKFITTINLIPKGLEFKLEKVPLLGTKLSKPFVLGLNRISYVPKEKKEKGASFSSEGKSKFGRYYEIVIKDGKFTIGNKEPGTEKYSKIDLKEGLSYDIKLEMPNFDWNKKKDDVQKQLEKGDDDKESSTEASEGGDESAKDLGDKDKNLKWIDLDKKIGPMYLGRIGIGLDVEQSLINLNVDATLNLSILQMTVLGMQFGLSANPSQMFSTAPKLSIEGLGINFKAGAVEIGGFLLKLMKDKEPEYVGQVFINTPGFKMIGTAMYSKTKSGKTSLFIYAYLDIPLGGPPFFEVQGLALGYGHNRKLKIGINDIAEFPLVRQALELESPAKNAKTIRETANKLSKYLPIQEGSYLIMIGIKFSSFKIINGFLLLAIRISEKPRIDILGLVNLTLEAGGTKAIFIELALQATIDIDEGVVSVMGLVTSNSFILDKSLKPTGGFALKTWTKGEHAGDFVITVGGYSKSYNKPSHYPTVPRVGLSWSVSSYITLKAEAYFALTPEKCMGGGLFYVNFNAGVGGKIFSGSIEASFKAKLDFEINWQPFHYQMDVQISIHVKVKVSIDTFFKTFSVDFELYGGANLSIWGPEFSGKGEAKFFIKWKAFKLGFTTKIEFGKRGGRSVPSLRWAEFVKKTLPQKGNDELDLLSFDINQGLEQKKKETIDGEEKTILIISKKSTAIDIQTKVPLTNMVGSSLNPGDNTPHNVTITQVNNRQLKQSSLKIKVDGSSLEKSPFMVQKHISQNMPMALYGGGRLKGTGLNEHFTGVRLVYRAQAEAGKTSLIPRKNLTFFYEENNKFQSDYNITENTDPLTFLKNMVGEDFGLLDVNSNSYKEFITQPVDESSHLLKLTDDIVLV